MLARMSRPMKAPQLGPSLLAAMALVAGGCGFDTSAILAPDCGRKVTLDAELHVDPSDDRWIWAIDRQTGNAISLRLGPDAPGVSTTPPAIIDGAGREVGKTGDLIVSGCYDVIQNAYQIDGSDLRPGG
jgi:hypothetical protein